MMERPPDLTDRVDSLHKAAMEAHDSAGETVPAASPEELAGAETFLNETLELVETLRSHVEAARNEREDAP